jgi:uncharacterized protein YyaL (SSP411 family)
MVKLTLQKMAQGGIYDQLGGGFHRYSVDSHWFVPHFEKMLYDNAQLLPLYVELYQITQEPLYARVARETLAYLKREMLHPEGGFYATQDADSDGEEGKFFVWTKAEVMARTSCTSPFHSSSSPKCSLRISRRSHTASRQLGTGCSLCVNSV